MEDLKLLSVDSAVAKVLSAFSVLPAESVPLLEALNRVLAEPAVASDNLPPFANSAMDGYALRSADSAGASRGRPALLRVVADIPAGTVSKQAITGGTAARITTGAPIPIGADAVIPVEDTSEPWRQPDRPLPEEIEVYRTVEPGDYVRTPGEDVSEGSEVLPAGHVIRPQEIGVLASLGLTSVKVIRKPRVAIMATGDELLDADEPLIPGKIRNSNSYALVAQVRDSGAVALDLGIAGDDESSVMSKLRHGLEWQADLFLSTAGVSVGAYDVVRSLLETYGRIEFWRINMRPGKPLAFGIYDGIPYMGLPGNPVSAAVTFERIARQAIRKMAGFESLQRPRIQAVLEADVSSDGRESYLRAVVHRAGEGYLVTLSGRQGSHVMTSLVKANGLLIVPAGVKQLKAGDRVEVMMIDWPEGVF